MSYLVHKRTSRNAFLISYIVFISFLSKKTPITFSSISPRISYHIILGRSFSFCLNQKNNRINLKVVYRISESKTSRVGNYDIINAYIAKLHIQVHFRHLCIVCQKFSCKTMRNSAYLQKSRSSHWKVFFWKFPWKYMLHWNLKVFQKT